MTKILFAHPDEKLVQLYQPHLSQYFSFDSAFDGLTALRKIRLNRPELVISGAALPQLSGLALLRFIRTDQNFQHVPFLFLADDLDAAQALSLGANAWLSRTDTSPAELLDKIYYYLKINQSILS